jgi:tetratricopeptide (TPR) repeat protein
MTMKPYVRYVAGTALLSIAIAAIVPSDSLSQAPRPPAVAVAAGAAVPPPACEPLAALDAQQAYELALLDEDGDKDDPSYVLYKEGYSNILDENWAEAKKKFDRLLKDYPKSSHREGAEYWSAHALMHIDRKKSRELYNRFILAHPDSRFYDDAIADLEQLNAKAYTLTTAGDDSVHVYVNGEGSSYAFTTAPRAMAIDRSMRVLNRQMRRLKATPLPGMRWGGVLDEKEDPETQLKLDALAAIGEMKEDDKSFQTLRDIAVDPSQPRTLRYAAIDGLSSFTKHDVVGVYLDIAKRDTSEELQSVAIDYISQASGDKKRSVDVLIDLFKVVPEQREEQQQNVLYSIAEVGTDRAIDFLVTVARTHRKYELRSDAVYLLGNIGGERARTALYEILKGK